MVEYKIRITRQARDHLREIRRYIEVELLAPLAAKNTIEAIKVEMQSLVHIPSRIHLTPEQPWHDQGVRRDRVKNYYIYFWIDEENKRVEIIGVIYVTLTINILHVDIPQKKFYNDITSNYWK